MKLFENGVGRPSNEIKKKRKIFVTLAASIIIILIGGVALLFNFNEKNLKGAATNNDFYITSSLDNNTLYLNKNTEQLKIVGLSNKDDVKWESSNDKIAKVDKNGKVTAKKIGKTSITVKTKDGKKKASYKITVKKKNIIFITASLGRRMDCWFNKYETSDGEIYKSKKRECEVEGEKLKAKGSNLAYNDDDSLFYVFRSGSPSSHQYSDADNIKSKEDDGKTEKKTPGLLKITKDMLKKIYSDKEERKYVELYVFFSLSGNGVKNETCEYIESPKNEMYKEYAIGYNNAINKLKAEGYSKVKGFVLSHAPLNTKHMIKDFNESKVVYSTNEKACNKNYRSGYKYVLSNRQMENAILVTKDKNDKKVSSNLTFVNFFDRIVTLDKAEDGMDKKTFTWKKNEDGKSYQKLVKTHDGLHWDKKTTKMMMPIILEEAGF